MKKKSSRFRSVEIHVPVARFFSKNGYQMTVISFKQLPVFVVFYRRSRLLPWDRSSFFSNDLEIYLGIDRKRLIDVKKRVFVYR